MNRWVRKSITIANNPGYLDKLHEVYPVSREGTREISPQIITALRHAYSRQDDLELMKILLGLPKFPIKDPYVAFLRKRAFFPEYNPKTVKRITQHLYSIGFEALVEGIEEAKEFNRQIGTLFKKWPPKLGYPILSEHQFNTHTGIAFLQGSNGELMRYANTALGCNLDKGLDMLAKAGSYHVIGEAKFLTDYGGHQNAQFADALALLRSAGGNAIRVAILDGVVWIKDHTRMYQTVCELEEPVFSALFLKDFLQFLYEQA